MSKSVARSIFSMIIINILIILSTVTLHELGHALSGKFFGCAQARAVIFDTENPNPYTELVCESNNVDKMYLSGIFLTTVFGFAFLTFDSKANRYLSIVVVFFGIFLASLDIIEVTGQIFAKYIFMFLGLSGLVIGQVLFGLEKAKE
ncbi:MAG: hypothetical protein QXF88_00165 [Candidatus Aenigmatarchaeota archaeon]